MEITHGSQIPFKDTPLKHREGGISFKTLATGTEGTLENFSLNIARQYDFYSPVHHHNFDQFRFALQGDVSLGPDMLLREGRLSYHPEGTYYGPQKEGPESVRHVLVFQCGGASKQGYMSADTLAQANRELAQSGKFEGGKYHANDGRIIDGYQALWEHYHGRKLVYPKGRYNAPVIMDPDNFAWKEVGQGVPGVWKRTLGVFSERELRAEQIKISSSSSGMSIGSDGAIELLFVLSGRGRIQRANGSDGEDLMKESCIRLDPHTKAEIFGEAESPITLLRYVIPLLSQ